MCCSFPYGISCCFSTLSLIFFRMIFLKTPFQVAVLWQVHMVSTVLWMCSGWAVCNSLCLRMVREWRCSSLYLWVLTKQSFHHFVCVSVCVKCMCMVGDKCFFLGSRLADSLLVQYTAGNASAGTPGFSYKPGKEEVGIVSNLCYHRYQRESGYCIGWILLMANLIKESKCSLEIFCTGSFVLQTL